MDLCRSGGHLTSSQVSGFYIKAQERVQAPCTDTCGDGRRLSEDVRLHVVWRVRVGVKGQLFFQSCQRQVSLKVPLL